MRIVVDTNIWISALVFGGSPRKVFEAIVADGHQLIVSEALLTEVRRIVHQKFPDFIQDFNDLLTVLESYIREVKLGSVTVHVSRDVDDNVIIETALIGSALYLVSGDKDLLVIGSHENVSIITVADFLRL